MSVQDSLEAGEEVFVETTDGTRLIRSDDGGGSVIEEYPDPGDGTDPHFRTDYDRFEDAKLHLVLWVLLGGAEEEFARPERSPDQFVPVGLVRHGREAVAAWLRTGGCSGRAMPADQIAARLGVKTDTVYDYLSRLRNSELVSDE